MSSQYSKEQQLRKLRIKLENSAKFGEFRARETCPDSQTDKRRGHDIHTNKDDVKANLNFDQKIYMFPPHYNLLRQELVEHWADSIWPLVAWRMAYLAEEFCEYMNACTGRGLVVDSDAVDWTCEQYLIELRKMRGLKV